MQGHFFFASHSLEMLSQQLANRLESSFNLFSPPLIVIPHPSMKEWLQLELCKKGVNQAVLGLECMSWRAALQRLGLGAMPTRLELSAAIFNETSTVALTDLFMQYVEGFALSETASFEQELFDRILRSRGWKTYPEALNLLSPSSKSVVLFAIDYLPPAIHSFFSRLPQLEVFRFSPCAMFWEDFRSDKQRTWMLRHLEKKNLPATQLASLEELLQDSHRLLANWGTLGRKMLYEWDAETNYDVEGGETLLNALKIDCLTLETPTFPLSPSDRSIQCVKTGASRLKEVQWLYEEISRLIVSGVSCADIRVYAPDIAPYAPLIAFLFRDIPFRIAGVDLVCQSGFYQAILQLFRCVQGRWEASFLLELFERPAFQWRPEETARLKEWIQLARVRWGIDRAHKTETTEVKNGASDAGSWNQGWQAMFDSLIFLQPAQESQISFGECELFERFYDTFHRLKTILLSWRENKTLADWASVIEDLIQTTLVADGTLETDRAAKHAIDQWLDGLKKASREFKEETFPFSWVRTSFSHSLSDEGGSMLHAVRFASLMPGAMVPARVIVCIGMDEESFPRSAACKLRDAPRPSDWDRYLFLQAIFSAKERLVISYAHSSRDDGKALSPSLVVQELLSYLDSHFAFSEGQLVSEAKIQESEEAPKSSLLINSTRVPEPVSSPVCPKELARFFRNPLQYYLKQVLGLSIPEELESEWKDFELSSLDRHLWLRSALQEKGLDLSMPLGLFGDLAKADLSAEISSWKERLSEWGIQPETISPMWSVPQGVLHLGGDDIGGFFRKWPDLLAGLIETGAKQVFCLRTGRVRQIADPATALQSAIDWFLRCKEAPSFLHAEWADALLRKGTTPELDDIKDRTLRWIMQRSPQFDLEKEKVVWNDAVDSAFSSLKAVFPVRGQ